MKTHRLVVGLLLVGLAHSASAALINFKNVDPNVPLSIGGVFDVHFSGFAHETGGSDAQYDADDFSDDNTDGLGSVLRATVQSPTIWFTQAGSSAPATVKLTSFAVFNYYSNWDDGQGDFHLFSLSAQGPNPFPVYNAPSNDPDLTGFFWKATGPETDPFASYSVTSLAFSNFQNSLIDRLIVDFVPSPTVGPLETVMPEPGSALVALGLAGLLLRRQRASKI